MDNEFLGTIAFSDKLSEMLTGGRANTWYGETCLEYEDEPAYQVGSHFGDAASIGTSIWEVGVGGGGAGLGILGAPETGGGSLAVTVGGGALALHGAGVGGTVLVKNLTGAAQEIFSFAQGRDGSQFNMADWNAKKPFGGKVRNPDGTVTEYRVRGSPGTDGGWARMAIAGDANGKVIEVRHEAWNGTSNPRFDPPDQVDYHNP